jgi:hypothetical protein
MHYRPKYQPHDGYIADANLVMEELHRAEDVLRNLDQNNIAEGVVATSDAAKPSTDIETVTVTHSSGSLLFEELANAWTMPSAVDDKRWRTLVDGVSGDELELTFTTVQPLDLEVDLNGTYASVASSATVEFRLLVDGEPSATRCNKAIVRSAGTAKLVFHVTASFFLLPGNHTVRAQVREWSNQGGTVESASMLGRGFAA